MKTKLLIATCLALQCFGSASKCLAQLVPRIGSADGSAMENAHTVSVTVSRWENLTAAVNVDYSTRDGTAKAGVDYTPVSGTLAFAAGETEKTISIPLADDDGVVDGDNTFRVFLTNATGGALIEITEGIVTILDNEVAANLDYSFNPVISSEYDNARVSSFATLPDGKLVIGGYFTRVNRVERSGLASLNADGSLAAAFQTRLLYAGQPARLFQVTPLPDGRVYIAGYFDSVNGVDRPGLARLLQDGSLDLSFAPTNLNYWWEIVRTDGKIIALTPEGLVRLNLDGRRDNSFVPTLLTNWGIYAFAEHTDGKLLVSGADGQTYRIIRLNTDGSLDNSFVGPGLADAQKLLVQPDQKILVTGTFYSTNGTPLTNLERLNADGSLDTGFEVSGGIDPLSLSLEASGKIMVLTGYRPITAWRLNSDGSLDSSFPGVQIRPCFCNLDTLSVAIKSIGAVSYVYGNFSTINGARSYGLGRILLDVPMRTGMDIQPDDTRGYNYSYLQVVGENEGLLTAKVRRLGQSTGPATVTYTTRDGTAKAGKDYVATTATISFVPLEVEKIVTVPILDNSVLDGRRTLQLFLTNAVGAEFVAPPLTMTILDNEFGFELGTITRMADGSVRMIVQVSQFSSVWLEVSSDLKSWTEATNLRWNYVSPFETEFIDPDAAQFPRRFYRLRAK